jgi:sugar phosphate permease
VCTRPLTHTMLSVSRFEVLFDTTKFVYAVSVLHSLKFIEYHEVLFVAAIAGEYLDDKMAGNLSTLFDVGGVVGGILAGYLSDHLKARAITAASFMFAAIPAMYCYSLYGSISLYVNIGLMMVTGMLINGPYALITTAVSADLGTHKSIRENGRALATVTAIIDGTGSVGAAIGPLLTGYISSRGWDAVFKMLMVAAFFSGILLTRLIIAELVEIFGKKPTVPSVDGELVVIPMVNITGSFLQICHLPPTV